MVDVTPYLTDRAPWIREHLINYLRTDGEIGYLRDESRSGASKVITCLVLKTIGRKSGKPNLLPLIYAPWGDEYVIVGSKGGAPQHPGWYFNIQANPAIEFQVKEKVFRGAAREAEGDERQRLWDYVTAFFPPYLEYQGKTERRIPVMILTAEERLDDRWTVAPDA